MSIKPTIIDGQNEVDNQFVARPYQRDKLNYSSNLKKQPLMHAYISSDLSFKPQFHLMNSRQ